MISKVGLLKIKSSTKPSIEDVFALEIFSRDYPDSHCIVICRTPRAYNEGRIKFMPYVEGMKEAITKASL